MSNKSMGRMDKTGEGGLGAVLHRTSLQQRMVSWLMLDGLKVQEVPQATEGWGVLVEDRAGRKIVVQQPLNRLDVVVLSAGCTLDRQRVEELPETEREGLVLELGLLLVQMGLDLGDVQQPLQGVTVVLQIYSEGLTRKEFGGAVQKVFRGVFAVLASAARRLGMPQGGNVETKVN